MDCVICHSQYLVSRCPRCGVAHCPLHHEPGKQCPYCAANRPTPERLVRGEDRSTRRARSAARTDDAEQAELVRIAQLLAAAKVPRQWAVVGVRSSGRLGLRIGTEKLDTALGPVRVMFKKTTLVWPIGRASFKAKGDSKTEIVESGVSAEGEIVQMRRVSLWAYSPGGDTVYSPAFHGRYSSVVPKLGELAERYKVAI